MVTNIKEAQELCALYKVAYTDHKDIVVTSSGNIYPNGNVDPKDKGEKFNPNEGEEETKTKKLKK